MPVSLYLTGEVTVLHRRSDSMDSTDKQDKKQRTPTGVLSKEELLKAIEKARHPEKSKKKQPEKKRTSKQ
jgi:hypothetical protein